MPSPDVVQLVHSALVSSWPPDRWRDTTVVAAVSGGPDSVVMLRAIIAVREQGRGRIVVAHYNHRLRGAESDADEQFVRRLAAQLNLQCHVGSMDNLPPGTHAGESLEGLVRKERYRFLKQAACEFGARYVAVAHTADDQAETILHRILRGTGLRGLAGMPRARKLSEGVSLVRPLLGVRRTEVLAYLEQLKQPFRHDRSNDSVRWTRNRIRHVLLPQLAAEYNPHVVDALLRLGLLAAEAQRAIERQAEQLLDRAVHKWPNGEVLIDCAKLEDVPEFLVRELLAGLWRRENWPLGQMNYRRWEQLARLVRQARSPKGGSPAQLTFPGSISARVISNELVLRREVGPKEADCSEA